MKILTLLLGLTLLALGVPPVRAADTAPAIAVTTIDLSPIVNAMIAVLAPALVAVVVWALKRWFGIQLDDRAKTLLEDAMSNGLALARERLAPGSGPITVDVRTQIVKQAADYVAAHVPDAARRLGIDLSNPADIEQKLEARLARL